MRVASLIASLRERERERVAARRKTIPLRLLLTYFYTASLCMRGENVLSSEIERLEGPIRRGRTPRPAPRPPLPPPLSPSYRLYTLAKQSNLLSPTDRGEKTTNVYTGWVDILTGEVVYCTYYYLPGFRHAFFSVLTFSSPQTKSINLSSSPISRWGQAHLLLGVDLKPDSMYHFQASIPF